MKKYWTASNIPSQAGRRAVITGSNSGIGFEAALALARMGAELILPARTQAKADDTVRRILQQVPNAQLHPEILDLAVQASVHAFASRMVERFPGQSLDLLINNAGVMALPAREITEDGFERQFATNYLGPFALGAAVADAPTSEYEKPESFCLEIKPRISSSEGVVRLNTVYPFLCAAPVLGQDFTCHLKT